jgi:hypothetical protein
MAKAQPFDLDAALRAKDTVTPLTKEQKARLRFWDYNLYWVNFAVEKQRREKEKADATV